MQLFNGKKFVGLLTSCCLVFGLAASSCWAAGESPWMVRVRALGIFPDDSSSQITGIGGEAAVDSAWTAELDISYFFTPNIALELVLAYAEHDVTAENVPGVGNIDLGSLDLLPPSLLLQYHFMPEKPFRPYITTTVRLALPCRSVSTISLPRTGA